MLKQNRHVIVTLEDNMTPSGRSIGGPWLSRRVTGLWRCWNISI